MLTSSFEACNGEKKAQRKVHTEINLGLVRDQDQETNLTIQKNQAMVLLKEETMKNIKDKEKVQKPISNLKSRKSNAKLNALNKYG